MISQLMLFHTYHVLVSMHAHDHSKFAGYTGIQWIFCLSGSIVVPYESTGGGLYLSRLGFAPVVVLLLDRSAYALLGFAPYIDMLSKAYLLKENINGKQNKPLRYAHALTPVKSSRLQAAPVWFGFLLPCMSNSVGQSWFVVVPIPAGRPQIGRAHV